MPHLARLVPMLFGLFQFLFLPVRVPAQESKADQLVKQALELQEKSKFDQVVKFCNKAIKADPASSWAYNVRGMAYRGKRDYVRAIMDYTKALELAPGYKAACYNRGNVYRVNGDNELAIADYNMVLESDPSFVQAYNNRGLVYSYQEDYDLAVQDFTSAVKLNPNYAYAYHNRGLAYERKGNLEQSSRDYKKALELEPGFAKTHVNRGFAYYAKDDGNQAGVNVGKSNDKVPVAGANSAIAYNNLALAEYNKGNYHLALANYNKALGLDPKYVMAYNNLGLVYFTLGEYDQAINNYNKALEYNPRFALAYNNRGFVYYNKGNYSRALEDYNEALKLEPLNKFALVNVLPCLIRLNRFSEAANMYDKYKKSKIQAYIEGESWQYYKYYLHAATIHVKNGHYNEGLSELKTAEAKYTSYNSANKVDSELAARKGYADILALKGYILEKLNMNDEAKDTYSQALVISANQPEVKTRLSAIGNRQALAVTKDQMAPVIELYNPAPSSTLNILSNFLTTPIIGRARDASGISKLSINGKAVTNEEDGIFVSSLQIKSGANIIQISAVDKAGNKSSRNFVVNCNLITKKDTSPPEISIPIVPRNEEPQYYAILIGENDYTDPGIPDLKNPIRDAYRLKEILESKYTFKPSNIDTLFNRSREDIMKLMIQRCNTLKESDNLLIFYAGHGTAEKDFKGDIDGYLIPTSAGKGNYSAYISSNDIVIALKKSRANHILLIADACFSGSLTRGLVPNAPLNIQEAYGKQSRKVMASGNLQPVPDNSVFMNYLIKALGENKDQYLRAKKLFNDIEEAVNNNSDSEPQFAAIKGTGDEGGDFIFIKNTPRRRNNRQ